MGIRFYCPNGHKLNVKTFQAGRRGICPYCGVSVDIPLQSTRPSSKELRDKHDYPLSQDPSSPNGGYAAASPPDAGSAPAAVPGVSTEPAGSQPAPAVMPEGPSQPVQPLAEPQGPGASAFPAPAQEPAQAPTFGGEPGQPAAVPDWQAPGPAPGPAAETPPQAPQQPAGTADAIAEAPDAVWYIRPPSGGQFGPATGEIMRGWIAEGRVAHDSLVWREGWRDWLEAGEAFPQLKPEPTPGELISGAASGGSTAAAAAHRPVRRRQSNTATAVIITGLVLAVIVLFAVFIFILTRSPT